MLKVSSLIILALFFSANSLFAQLIGTAFLANQSNHSGIKVKFKANPGTAITDSTLTDALGNYSINISPGSYNISFTKVNYSSAYYNNNSAVILTNTMSLNSATLYPGIIEVSGTVSGTWVNSVTYLVKGDLVVPFDSTLIIQPGATIKFDGFYGLSVVGILDAQGTASNPISFLSNKITTGPSDWKYIKIQSILSKVSKIKYCKIECAADGIVVNLCNPIVTNNEISRFVSQGISLYCSYSDVKYNKIHTFYNGAYGISISGYSIANPTPPTTVQCNEIYNAGGSSNTSSVVGINCVTEAVVKDNECHSISGSGISAENGLLMNNIVYNCGIGISFTGDSSEAVNNTIYNSNVGIQLNGSVGKKVINNSISNCTIGVKQVYSSATPTILNNSFWNNQSNSSTLNLLGFGMIITNNGNGDPVDAYYNIFIDPNFVDGVPPYLNLSSPCNNAGNVSFSSNIGCNTETICSFIFTGLNSITYPTQSEIKTYPNPFENEINVSGENIKDIILYNILGSKMTHITVVKTNGSYKIDTSELSSGVYFVKISLDDSLYTVKLIKN